MKKIIGVIAAISLTLFAASCASTGPSPGMLDVQNARTNKPNDTLVGVASNTDKAQSETRARSQITRALTFIARSIVVDYKAAGGAGADALEVELNQAVARSRPSVETAKQHLEKKEWWTVYYLEKDGAQKEIKTAEAAAKANVPAAAAFNSDAYFEKAFKEAANREWLASN